MKTSDFSLKFLLAMGFPFVLLAITPSKAPGLISDELDGSGIDSEDDDFYSGSGSGDGFWLKNSYSNTEHTTVYSTLPSTASSNLYSSSQVTMTEIASEVIAETDVNAVSVQPNLAVVNTTVETIVTSSMSSTSVSKDIGVVLDSETKTDNFLARAVGPKRNSSAVAVTQVIDASRNVRTTIPDHAVAVINNASLAVPRVAAASEMTAMVVQKVDPTEQDTEMVTIGVMQTDTAANIDDLFFSDVLESRTVQIQNHIADSRGSVQPPKDSYSHDFSSSGSFLERRELLAATVAGGFVGLVLAVLLVVVLVYRMKKKDEGSYTLDESKQPNGGYQKPQKQEEFYA
ncbi:syndecan-3-like [Heptranchias perlo]|uniref:syndecan-3-like n=1 Tax=Heptranchias perlo TaxID=212740 RepID=UPI00355A3A55